MGRHLSVYLAALLLVGCSMNRMVANNMVGSMADMQAAFFAESSPDQGFYGGPALLKQLDGFILSAPENEALLLSGASMNCGYALTFLDLEHPDWAAHLYRKGIDYALRGLTETNEELAAAVRADDLERVEELLAEMDVEDDLPFVFWTGLCWGGLMNATQDEQVALALPLVKRLIKGCVDKDPRYFFASGHTFFGMLNARAKILGGNLKEALPHFEEALRLTEEKFLLVKVLYARSYAVAKQDVGLYLRLLNEVVSASFEDPSEMRLPNAVARRDARSLLKRTGDFFPGYEGKTGLEPNVEPLIEEDVEDLDLD